MAKVKQVFVCQQCGYESAKWLGKCTACNEWNTLVEETVSQKSKTKVELKAPVKLTEIEVIEENRTKTGELFTFSIKA